MAKSATVRKLTLAVADIDREHYETYELTLAQHPSENAQRLMLRVLAFAMFAHPDLAFGRGVSTDDEPDLWQTAMDGTILRWIDLGMPDERRLRKACSRADQAALICYGGSKADVWLQRNRDSFRRFNSLQVWNIASQESEELSALIQRSMKIGATIQDGQVLLSDDERSVTVRPEKIYPE